MKRTPATPTVTLLSALVVAAPCFAHPYLPLHEGDVTVLDYRFHVETDRPELRPPDRHGKMIHTTGATEVKNGKPYVRFTTSYQGIEGIDGDVQSWRREEDGNVYAASMVRGRWSETLELPKDVSVGREWDYDDGVRSRRRVTARKDLKLGGKVFRDCIEVTRVKLASERHKAAKNTTHYCPNVGEAKFFFEQPSPFGDYVTETSLLEHVPAK